MRPTPESSVTQDLVERARHGDREAFGALVDRYRERLEALVHLRLGKRLRQKVEPEDVLQEVYVRARPALQSFQLTDKGSFFRWFGAIAEHVIQDLAPRHLEAEKRALSHERSLERERLFEARGPSPSEILRRWERLERLEAALDRLHPDHREVIILSVVRGLLTREIAERMHRSPQAVGMLLLRAVRKLREEFGTTDSFHLPASSIASLDGGSDPKGGDREVPPTKPPESGPARTS